MRLRKFVKTYSGFLSKVFYLIMNNQVRETGKNLIKRQKVFCKGLRAVFSGGENELILGGAELSVLTNLRIEVHGSHNRIIIEGGVRAKDLKLYCADDHCIIHIKEGSQISGKTELAVMEGTKILVGRDCLFSANITLRAGDSHSVIDAETGARLNYSKDIIIGDHVWIGNTVIITKGTIINDNSVVATGSVVAGKTFPANSVLGGNPAKVIKEGVTWKAEKV